jgi:hypothetical protein
LVRSSAGPIVATLLVQSEIAIDGDEPREMSTMTGTKAWTRPQDWVNLVGGGYLALSPLWVSVGTGGTWAMVVIGVVIAVLAILALARPGAYVDEWATAAAGVVAFVAPWAFSFDDRNVAAWTSWIVGVVVAVSALSAVSASREVYHREHPAT